jgi:hypothetical protein
VGTGSPALAGCYPPGAAATGQWLPGALGHDLRDIVIAEPEVLADERTGDRPRRGLGTQPRLADSQDLRGLSRRVKLSHFTAAHHYALLFFRQGDSGESEQCGLALREGSLFLTGAGSSLPHVPLTWCNPSVAAWYKAEPNWVAGFLEV